ncbi:arylamine N-acetyltransferase family protein [Phenylobacterium sp.]|jgi:N-hydroxyarylamine O-acetyltransferase|uniref:arylamine N-acetyltransferase family protein n=1 Tax=Phenylobacterium sp. TaxID=1871053 RepID=UPI002F95B319
MDLHAYLDRIGWRGEARPDLATLRELHRSHLLAIPYENFDVQLGRAVGLEPQDAFAKIVERRRGGWCYEMNGLLGAALEAIGFKVTRLAGGVHRAAMGDVMVGNHLVLRVDLEEPWIADAGFGDGSLEPYPLKEGAFTAHGFDFRLERLGNGWWRFHNHPFGGAPNYDFHEEAGDPARLAERCGFLQSAPESPFVMNAVVQRFTPDGLLQMRGRTLRRVTPAGAAEELIGSADAYLEVLEREFGLVMPEAASLWPRIERRHAELFGEPA